MEQWMQDAANHFTRPWSGRRGIETIDRNAEVILVKVPIDQLSDTLESLAIASHRNVMGSEIELSGPSVLTYQLVGHSWSIMVEVGVSGIYSLSVLQSKQLAKLSEQLKQPVIRLIVSDTVGCIGYDLFENGEIAEYFSATEGSSLDDSNDHGIQPERYVWFSSPEELEEDNDPKAPEQIAYFWSRRRQIAIDDLRSIYSFADQFLREYDAFDPAIDDRYLLETVSWLEIGKRYRVRNRGFTMVIFGYDADGRGPEVTSVPDLARVDCFVFSH